MVPRFEQDRRRKVIARLPGASPLSVFHVTQFRKIIVTQPFVVAAMVVLFQVQYHVVLQAQADIGPIRVGTFRRARALQLYRRVQSGGFGAVFIIIDRNAGFQRGQDESLPHRLGRHPPGKPGAAEIDRPLLVDAAIDRPVRDECIKRILR